MIRTLRNLALALALCLALPAPAHAGPITAIITAINAWAATSALAAFTVRLGVSLALSALSSALSGRGRQRAPGIKTEATTSGGSNPQTFILGRYATGGNLAAPPYSHPNSGATPNEFLTYVIDVSDMPGVTLSRIIVAGEYITDLAASAETHALEGMLQDGTPHLYLTWHDGTQTAADPYMMENYASHPDRPWAADMVGTGVAYGVVTFRYNRELFNQLPGVRFEVDGLPLYDPRLDSTVGGSGAHRWGDASTYAQTDNPLVMIYNILRGITLPDGRRWGGKVAAADLPLDVWFAAMNECDVQVALAGGGTEPQYRAGLEVSLDEEPAAVIDKLLNAASAEITEFGGTYKVRVGPPALPVYFFSDDDVVADKPETMSPYGGLESVHNAIHATYPEPAAIWEKRDAPPRYNATWEAEDEGRQLVAEVDLPAVPYEIQVQRLMKAWIEDERRFVRHTLGLPPDAAILEPLDTIAWTSARHGYAAKVFEVGELTDELRTALQTLAIREREASDYTFTTGDEIAVDHPPLGTTPPPAPALAGWTVAAASITDASGTARRPGLTLTWDATGLPAGQLVEWQVRPQGLVALVSQGTSAAAEGGQVVSDGLASAVDYEARARLIGARLGDWTTWAQATTPDLRLTSADLEDGLLDAVARLNLSKVALVVPTDENGNNPNLTNAVVGLQVVEGGTDETANWSLSALDGSGVTSSLAGTTLTITGLTAASATVTITATRAGYVDLVQELSVARAPAGADGAQGTSPISVNLWNAAHTLPANNLGQVTSYAESGTVIELHEGATALNFTTSTSLGNGQWRIYDTDVEPGSNDLNVGQITDGGNQANVGPHGDMDQGEGVVTVKYDIQYRTLGGAIGYTSTIQTLTKSVAGTDGTPGTPGTNGKDAITFALTPSAVSLPATAAGLVTDYSASGGSLYVYEGGTELNFTTATSAGSLTNGSWQIYGRGRFPTAFIDLANISDGGFHANIGQASSMATDEDGGRITYYVRVQRADGTQEEHVVGQTFAKAFTGLAGDTGPRGSSVLVVYAADAGGTDQSTTPGSREFVQYVEYTGDTPPSLPVGGTFVRFIGIDGAPAVSIWPIYADDVAGNGQSFTASNKKFVTFYESLTQPTLPVAGATFVPYKGDNGDTVATGRVYYQTLTTSNPGTPSATSYDFATGQFSGGSFAGGSPAWGTTQPVADATDTALQEFSSEYVVTKNGETGNITIDFSVPVGAIQFPVTIQSDDFDGNANGTNLGNNGWSLSRDGVLIVDMAYVRGKATFDQIQIDNVLFDTDGNGNITITGGGIKTDLIGDGEILEAHEFIDTGTVNITTLNTYTQVAQVSFTDGAEGFLDIWWAFEIRATGGSSSAEGAAWRIKETVTFQGQPTSTRIWDRSGSNNEWNVVTKKFPINSTSLRSSGTTTVTLEVEMYARTGTNMSVQVADRHATVIQGKT